MSNKSKNEGVKKEQRTPSKKTGSKTTEIKTKTPNTSKPPIKKEEPKTKKESKEFLEDFPSDIIAMLDEISKEDLPKQGLRIKVQIPTKLFREVKTKTVVPGEEEKTEVEAEKEEETGIIKSSIETQFEKKGKPTKISLNYVKTPDSMNTTTARMQGDLSYRERHRLITRRKERRKK